MDTTRQLAAFAVEHGFDDIPQNVVERAKELILDAIGATVLGSITTTGRMVTASVKEEMCRPEASILGAGFRSSLCQTAFANGSLLHSTELEADPMASTGLPAPAILVALASGERSRTSGKKVLEGFILGYEIQGRVRAGMPGMGKRGFGVAFGTLGPAAAASKILGLDVDRSTMALGIAASQASGIIAQVGTMTHFLEMGMAARNGAHSALLAQSGITAMPDVIEHPDGYSHVFAGDGGYDLEVMTKNLGNPYLIVSPGIYIKKYPCCFRNHRALDAVFELISKHSISYEQVATVEVGINKWDATLLRYSEPTSGSEAMFSLNHCLASAILKGRSDWKWWTDESATDAEFKKARGKINVVFHPEWPPDRSQSRVPVKLQLKDGRTFSHEFSDPINPSREAVIERYRQCTEPVLSSATIEKSIDVILNLEKMDDVSKLMDLVRGPEQA